MKQLIFITSMSFLLMVGCGMKTPKVGSHYSNGNEYMADEFRPYFNSFVSQAVCLNTPLKYEKLSIHMVPSMGTNVGMCYWSSDGKLKIDISEVYWKQLSMANRERVLVHELAHCALKASHTDPSVDFYQVMNPTLLTRHDTEFMSNYDYRIKQVFKATDNTSCDFTYTELQTPGPANEMAMRAEDAIHEDLVLEFGHDQTFDNNHTGHEH